MAEIKKVLANHSQTFTSAEQQIARTNIGASKAVLGNAPTVADSESVSGMRLERDLTTITPTKKSLLLITVHTGITLDDSTTPGTLGVTLEAPPAIRLGESDGGVGQSTSVVVHAESSAVVLSKYASFYAILNANQSLTIKGTFSSSVAGFQATFNVNYSQLALE